MRTLGAGALASAMIACGSAPTSQLVDARKAYDDAEHSGAHEHAPGDLAEARVALDRAEDAHDKDPGSRREMRLAERAERKARAAEAHGDALAERHNGAVAAKTEERHEVVKQEQAAAQPTQPETRHADAALQSLAQVASVKEEPRGVVVTMSGALLFPNGEKALSPIGRENVDRVAHALAQQPKDSAFQVIGYTDNTGSDKENQELSAARAHAVADRLVEAGIDSGRVTADGRGEADPVASNDTREGRASNRRVEIIVSRSND
jgi:outer membrane protein OmpA-like peptidoglycan-associated protein